MQFSRLLDYLPLWALFLVTLVVVLLFFEFGYRLGCSRRLHAEAEKEGPVGAMVGATLGLLAFMLAFTFGLAGSRFDERRLAALDETNAIGTTYLRAATLPEPIASETRDLLREYVDVRLEGVRSGNIDLAISRSEELHQRLWSNAVAATDKDRSPITGLFIQSLNEVIDIHTKRVMFAMRSRVPGIIWLALYLLAVLAMSAMGYHHGLTSPRRSPAIMALVLAFLAVLMLNVDLDRPGEGTLRVSQQSLIDLRNSMSATSAGPQLKSR